MSVASSTPSRAGTITSRSTTIPPVSVITIPPQPGAPKTSVTRDLPALSRIDDNYDFVAFLGHAYRRLPPLNSAGCAS
jgi:hypothetical protein